MLYWKLCGQLVSCYSLNPEDEVVTHSANVNHKAYSAKAFTYVALKSKVLECGYAQC